MTALAAPAAAQIVTENAGVLSPVTPLLRESVTYFGAHHLDEIRWSHQLTFALDTSRELKLTVPTLWRRAELEAPAGRREMDELLGLADASLRFKQSLFQVDDVMESTRWAALAEVTAPTGEDDHEAHGIRLPRRLQLGQGDWSVGAGTAVTVIRDRHRFSVEGFFRHRTRHEGIRLGQSADLNLAYWYRLIPGRFTPADAAPIELRGVIELLTAYRWRSRVGEHGADDEGVITWLAPGLQLYPSKKVLFEANVQVPLYQDLDDALGHRNIAASLVVKFLF